MPIAVLILALVAYGYVLLAYPEIRLQVLAAGAVVAAVIGFYFWRHQPEAARAGARIDASEVTLDQLTLERTARGATLSGRVRNGSARYQLRDLTLDLRLRDCPAPDTPADACPIIGEARAIARPDVPPGQIRALGAHFLFSDVPALAGTLRWDWQIVETRATD